MIHGHFTASQAQYHAQFGGVFPAMAKLEHIKACVPLIHSLFIESHASIPESEWSKIDLTDEEKQVSSKILHREPYIQTALVAFCKKEKFPKIDFISVTNGPGLEPALWVGVNFARALGIILKIPVVSENHMLGHLYSSLLPIDELHTEIDLNTIPSSALGLLVSGGHTQIIQATDEKVKDKSTTEYKLLGNTLDDAVGEAFDKVARLLGLAYPGGKAISELAKIARDKNITPVDLPRPMLHSKDYDFSYSGLKTAVMYYLRKFPITNEEDKLALALGFENSAIEVIIKKTTKVIIDTGISVVLLGGGVSANTYLRSELKKAGEKYNFTIHYPLMSLTGDNALMIALTSGIRHIDRLPADESDTIKANGMLQIAS